MSFKKNDYQQISISDSYMAQSERTKKYLSKSWAEGFANLVFPKINEDRFAVLYSDNDSSRPNTPVNIIIGALMLKELNGLTDDELLEEVLFDIRYQYALWTTSYKEQPFSDRTVSRFRERLREHEEETGEDLLKAEMLSLADVFCEYMKMDKGLKRMDSIMVASNCKRMSRLELFYTCVSNLVNMINKNGDSETIASFERYIAEDDKNNTIYRSKPEDVSKRIDIVLKDALVLLNISACKYGQTEEYKILSRLIDEQTDSTDGGIKLKESKKVSSSSLQNPSDPDATYRKKSGKGHVGYVGNIVETVDTESGAAIITGYDYQNNLYHDSQFCKDVIEDHDKCEDATTTIVADGAYYGIDNIERADEKNIELVTTSMVGSDPSEYHKDFIVDEDTRVILSCPAGHQPEHCWYNEKQDNYRLTFNREHCEGCPLKTECKAVIQKKNAVVKLSMDMIKRSRYLALMKTERYRELGRFRNGVEGVPSILRRRYRVDEIPDFGLKRSKIWFSLKVGAINVKRMLAAVTAGALTSFDSMSNMFNGILVLMIQTIEWKLRVRLCIKLGF